MIIVHVYVRSKDDELKMLTYQIKDMSFSGGMLLLKDKSDEFNKELLIAVFAPGQWVFVEVVRGTT